MQWSISLISPPTPNPTPEGRANHWSALIGASHSRNYVLWEYGGLASEGVRQVAELGSPVKMEEEIRQKVRPTTDTLYIRMPTVNRP